MKGRIKITQFGPSRAVVLGFSPLGVVMPVGKCPLASQKELQAKANCLMLFAQVVRRPDSRAALMAGRSRAIRIPMMAMTTSSSTSVKALRCIDKLLGKNYGRGLSPRKKSDLPYLSK